MLKHPLQAFLSACVLLACDEGGPDAVDADGDTPDGACPDPDGDLVCSAADNCPDHPNEDQLDSDADGVGDACDGGLVHGLWPQASGAAFMSTNPIALADRYSLVRGATGAGADGVEALGCGTCSGECGLDLPVPPAELLVSVSDEATWAAWRDSDSQRVARLSSEDGLALTAASRVESAPWIDLAQVSRADGSRYLVGLAASRQTWLVGLSADSGDPRWRVAPPRDPPPDGWPQPSSMVVTGDSRFLIVAQGRLYASSMPADGETGIAIEVPLDADGVRFSVAHVALDDRGRLYVSGSDRLQPPACLWPYEHSITRLRVFGPSLSLLAELEPSGVGPIRVERALEHEDAERYRVVLLTDAEDCETVLHYPKSPYEFSDDPADLYACPESYRAVCEAEYPPLPADASPCCMIGAAGCAEDSALEACVCGQDPYCCDTEWTTDCVDAARACGAGCPTGASTAMCPCALCSGLLQICPPPLCLAGDECSPRPRTLLEVHVLDSTANGGLVVAERRGFPVTTQPWELALDGHGHAAIRGGRVLDLNADAPGEAELITLPTEQIGAALLDGDAPGGLRLVTGWAPELLVFGETVRLRPGLVVARVGSDSQAISHTSDLASTWEYTTWGNDAFKPVWVSRLYPLPGGRLLAVGAAPSNRSELRLFTPASIWALGKDLATLPADEGPPEVDPCPDRERCRSFDLGTETSAHEVFDLSDEAGLDWVGCVTRTRNARGEVTSHPCDEAELRASWEESAGAIARLTTGHRVACVGTTTRLERVAGSDPDAWTETKYLRCTSWRELFVPGDPPLRSIERVALWPRLLDAPACSLLGQPSPLRMLVVSGPELVVSAAGPDGTSVVEAGDEVAIAVTPAAAGVELVIVGGVAELGGDDDGDGRVTSADGTFSLTATTEGAVTVLVIVRDAQGRVIGEQRVVIIVDGPRACTETDDGFRLCNARPGREILAESEQPSLVSPAVAAVGVQLHDRSLVLHEVDATIDSVGPPVVFARTWRSANLPIDGGDLGGWTFGYDQRLVPATDEQAWTLIEPREAGVDLAFLDGTGRTDVFEHPGATDTITFGEAGAAGPHYWVYDHAAQALRARSFQARVTTYRSPRGMFATLRAYTLVIPDGMQARDVHPFHPRAGEASPETELRPDEARFYELSDSGGTRRIFDCRGMLVRIIDPRFHEVELIHRGPSSLVTRTPRPSQLIDGAGRRHSLEWTEIGGVPRLHRVIAPHGRTIEYAYTAQGTRLSAVTTRFEHPTDPARSVSETRRYVYDEAGRLVAVVEPDAFPDQPTMAIDYDAQGRVVRQRLGRDATVGYAAAGGFGDGDDGATWEIAHAEAGAVVTDPNGVARTYALEALPDNGPRVVDSVTFDNDVADAATLEGTTTPARASVRLTTTFGYHASGQLASMVTPSGRRSELDYDDRGRLIERRELPIGGGAPEVTALSWVDANAGQHVSFACWALESETLPGGAMTTYEHADFDASAPGRTCQVAALAPPGTVGAGGEAVTWHAVYDYVPDGVMRGALRERRVEIDGVVGATTVLDYAEPEPAAGEASSFRGGKIPIERAAHPSALTLSGRPVGPLAAECGTSAEPLRTELETDLLGGVVAQRQRRVVACDSGAGCDGACEDGTCVATVRTELEYDAAGRVIRIVEDADADAHVTEHEYDAMGRLRRTVVQVEDAFDWDDATYASGATAIEPREGQTIETEVFYDRLGRIAGVIRRGDDLDHVLISAWDGVGNPRYRLEPGAGADAASVAGLSRALRAGTPAHRIIEEHDPEHGGNLALVDPADPLQRNPRVVLRTFEHDADGALIAEALTDGAPASGCAPCDAAHHHRQELYRDADGLVVALDTGRTDRRGGDGARVILHQRYDARQRLVSQRVLDPLGPPGCEPGVAVREATWDDFDAAGFPRREQVRGYDGAAAVEPASGALVPVTCTFDRLLSSRRFERDPMGHVIEERVAILDGFGAAPSNADLAPPRVRRTLWDHTGQPIESWVEAAGAKLDHERRQYDHLGRTCFEATYLSGAPVRSVRSIYDGSGGPAAVEERHHGAGGYPDVVVARRFRYDRAGRLQDLVDGLGRVTARTIYDSAGRIRGQGDLRGAWREHRYDALGNLIDERFIVSASDVRRTVASWVGPFKVGEQELVNDDPRGGRTYEYGVRGEPVRIVPFGGEGERLEVLDNEVGAPWLERTMRGAEHHSTVDAMGHVIRIDAVLEVDPGPLPSGEPLLLAAARELRFNALGQTTMARSTTRDGTPIATVLQGWTSEDDLRFEEQYRHAAAGGPPVRHRADATYDVRGNITSVTGEVPGGEPIALTYRHDDAGRLTAIEGTAGAKGLFRDVYLERISYVWAGAYPVERTVTTMSTFLGRKTSARTVSRYDELGERYRIEHYGPDGSLRHFQQRYWHGADAVLSRSAWVVDGEEQGDLGSSIDALTMLGASHLAEPPPRSFFAPLPAYDHFFADNPLDSVYVATRHDAAGAVVESFTTAYGAYSGRPTLRATWRTLDGDRLEAEQTVSWDPIEGKATEIAHMTMEYEGEVVAGPTIERVRRTRHYVTHEPELDALPGSPLPLTTAGGAALGEVPVERADNYRFEYTGGALPLHDGCAGGTCGPAGAIPRHRYVYDAFDQLAAVVADEPAACSAPGPLENDLLPVAVEYRVAWDGFGRRVYERYPLPAGCNAPASALDGEVPRGMVYLGEELMAERFDVSWDAYPATSLYVHGADDVPFIATIFAPSSATPRQAHYEVLEDATGALVGVHGANVYRRPGAPAGETEAVETRAMAWFRAYPTLRLDPAVSWPMRWLGGGAEAIGFGRLSYHADGGYLVDLTSNPETDRWYATRPLGFFGTLEVMASFLVSMVVDMFREVAWIVGETRELLVGAWHGSSSASLSRRGSRLLAAAGMIAVDMAMSAFTGGAGGVASRAGRKALRKGVEDVAERALRIASRGRRGGGGLTFHGDAALAFLRRNGLTDREVAAFIAANDKLGGGLEIAIRSFKKKAPYRRQNVEDGMLAKPIWQKTKTDAQGKVQWRSSDVRDPITKQPILDETGQPVPLHEITVTGDVDLGYVLKDGVPLEREAVQFRREFRYAYRQLPGPNNPTIKHGPHLDLRHVQGGDFRFKRGRSKYEVKGIRNDDTVFKDRADVHKDLEKIGPPGHMFTLKFDARGRLSVHRLGPRDNIEILRRLQPEGGWPSSWFERTLAEYGLKL